MNTPARARSFSDDVQAPVKELTLIEGAGHFAAYKGPELFLDKARCLERSWAQRAEHSLGNRSSGACVTSLRVVG